mmetsp:Transcript_5881/g.15950  ORF Transcript_5881/g.15950 Transcript_5881/m.15950 type:complete len:311 (+) Transcript_5881:162-1094(+)
MSFLFGKGNSSKGNDASTATTSNAHANAGKTTSGNYNSNNGTGTGTGTGNSDDPTATLNAAATLAGTVFTPENVSRAARAAQERAQEIQKQAQDGNISLRAVAFLGGILLMMVSLRDCLGKILSFQLVGAVLELFTFFLSIIVILLEAKTTLLPGAWVDRIHKYALFLKYMWGRGSLYFMAGALQLSHFQDILDLIAGAWMCVVGAMMVFVGQQTAQKLQTMRKQLYTEHDLKQIFSQANVDGVGLNVAQFRDLTVKLGLDLTRRETESALLHMKKDNSKDRLSYEEFLEWWTQSSDATESMADSPLLFV